MANYALYNGYEVVNVILAGSKEIAEAASGFTAVETDGTPWIGWTLDGDEWRPPMPTDGTWEWDADTNAWVSVTLESNPQE
jgi:hypothetical protein